MESDSFKRRRRVENDRVRKQTRYTTKYTQEKQIVVVKVTDDIACLKYRTDSVAVVKQLSELSGWIMEQCTQK